MRNGTQSSEIAEGDYANDAADAASGLPTSQLVGIGAICATVAVVIGYYAIWLTRQRAARQTLTDVQDILNLCRDRMRQMESDISHLPHAVAGS